MRFEKRVAGCDMDAGFEETGKLRKKQIDISGELDFESGFGLFEILTKTAKGLA